MPANSAQRESENVRIRFVRWLSLAALTLVPLGQVHFGFGAIGAVTALAAAGVGLRRGDSLTLRVALMTLLILLTGVAGIPFGIWLVVLVLWAASRLFPSIAPDSGWLPAGTRTPAVGWLTGLVVVGAAVGLTLWARWTQELGESTTEMLEAMRRLPGLVLFLVAVVFVIVNAISEEIAYRGIAFEAASSVLAPVGAVIAQAVAFGALHVAGFPSGLVGVGLAFGYGLVLGAIRQMSNGLRFPIVAHLAADATIAVIAIGLL